VTQIKIKVEGVSRLKKLDINSLHRGVVDALKKALGYVWEAIPPEPPPPPASRYVRTHKLAQKFLTDVDAKPLGTYRGWIGSAVQYAPWVISRERVEDGGPQAWMHVGRWWLLQDVVESRAEVVAKAFQDVLQEWIDGI
jgi:hypothetical protein